MNVCANECRQNQDFIASTDVLFNDLGLRNEFEFELLRLKPALTREFGLVVGHSFEAVSERGEDALHSAEHGAEAQVEQHEEEERRPEGAAGQQGHGLGEGDKS